MRLGELELLGGNFWGGPRLPNHLNGPTVGLVMICGLGFRI